MCRTGLCIIKIAAAIKNRQAFYQKIILNKYLLFSGKTLFGVATLFKIILLDLPRFFR